MKKYYGIATVAAIGAGLWWWFTREAGATEPDCLDDGDCPHGYVCENGVCVPIILPDCVSDGDCPSGYICENGICVPDSMGVPELVVQSITLPSYGLQRNIDYVTLTITATNIGEAGEATYVAKINELMAYGDDSTWDDWSTLTRIPVKTLTQTKYVEAGGFVTFEWVFIAFDSGWFECCDGDWATATICDYFHVG